MTTVEVTSAFSDASRRQLKDLAARIRHCLNQLTDEQVWWRPSDVQNSIANLILHLCGNVRQWIISGVGGVPDTRDRPKEFSDRSQASKAELLHQLDEVLAETDQVLAGLTPEQAVAPRRIQGFDGETGISAIFHSIAHFYGHTQEIVHMTRTLLGEKYQFEWEPKTPEEGAPSA